MSLFGPKVVGLSHLTADDLKNMKIDEHGNLYWKGHRVRVGNFSWTTTLAIIASLAATGGAGFTIAKNGHDLGIFGAQPKIIHLSSQAPKQVQPASVTASSAKPPAPLQKSLQATKRTNP